MIDLHLHSECSDGTDSVEVLIDNLIDAGVKTFALSDHDTAVGCRQVFESENLKQKIKDAEMTFIPAIEISCVYKGRGVHILAYDIDPFSKEIMQIEQGMRDLLKEKDVFRFKAIKDAGYEFSKKSQEFLSTRVNVRDADIANCLVWDGYYETVRSAMRDFTMQIKYPKKYMFDAVEVLKLFSKTNAKLVWAHSIHGLCQKPLSFEQIEEWIVEFKQYGLCGLECYYSLYSKDEIDKLLELAKKHNLYITCGSDYHGKNKEVKILERTADGSDVDESKIDIIEKFENIVN